MPFYRFHFPRLCALLLTAIALASGLWGCAPDYDSDIGDFMPDVPVTEAVVTVVPRPGNTFVMIVDSSTVLSPLHGYKPPFADRETRALATLGFVNGCPSGNGEVTPVLVSSLTAIPEPQIVNASSLSHEWGRGEITVSSAWPTLLEDGYLTLSVTVSGAPDTYAESCFKLVTGIDPSNPADMELRYKPSVTDGDKSSNLILAFNLNNIAGLKNGTDLTLHWTSPGGPCVLRLPIRLRYTSLLLQK